VTRAANLRAGLALALLGVGAWLGSTGLAAASRRAQSASRLAALAASGTWHGTAEGIRVDLGQSSSGDVDSTSESDYQVELSFSFSVSKSGEISGGGSGSYTDAHWHLYGQNGANGSFDCYPPITARPFEVDVSGHAGGGRATVSLTMPDATETNADYDCGAGYTGFATTTRDMADSLSTLGGDRLDISLGRASSLTVQKTSSSGGGGNSETDQHIWSFSFTPPGAGNTGGGGGGSGGRGRACKLSLTHVAAKPSRTPGGQPVIVRFQVSHAARTSLLVSPPSGASSSVATLTVPSGRATLVWGGWIGTRPAAAGRYKLTVAAAACGTTRRRAVGVTIS
jgi:hypothetical protein